MRQFLDHIDRAKGIYKYRWGDAPIHSLALSVFCPVEQLHHFSDISYVHKQRKNFARGDLSVFWTLTDAAYELGIVLCGLLFILSWALAIGVWTHRRCQRTPRVAAA